MEYTFDQIEQLILNTHVDKSKMICEFEVSGTGKVIQSSSNIKRERTVTSDIKRAVTRNVTNQVRRSVSRLVRNVLGGGMVGRIGYQTVNAATRSTTRDFTRGFTSSEKEQAILEAFKKVASEFKYNANTGEWRAANIMDKPTVNQPKQKHNSRKKEVAPPNASPFELHLINNPVNGTYDKEILSRMLIEVANADSGVTVEEESFLKTFIENYDFLAQTEPLSPIECEEVTESAKTTCFLLASAASLVDLEIHPLEMVKLEEFGEWMGVEESKMEELHQMAKAYVLEQAVEPTDTKESVYYVGQKLGLSDEDALRLFIKYKKRLG